MDRRTFVKDSAAATAALTMPGLAWAQQPDLAPVFTQVERQHDATVQRLQEWIRQPSIGRPASAKARCQAKTCAYTVSMSVPSRSKIRARMAAG